MRSVSWPRSGRFLSIRPAAAPAVESFDKPRRIKIRMQTQRGKCTDIDTAPNCSIGAGTPQCGTENRSWRRELWLQSLRDPSAYRIQDPRDYGFSHSPNNFPPPLGPRNFL